MKRKLKLNNFIQKKHVFKVCKSKDFINVDKNKFYDLINLSLGLYKPLSSFCNKREFYSILNKFSLNGTPFPLPVLLNPLNRPKLIKKRNYILKFNNKVLGYIKLDSYFKINISKTSKIIYKTSSLRHPGVQI